MVHTFQNVSFGLGSVDPMNPPYWTVSFTNNFEAIAGFNSSLVYPASAVESFELGYTQGIATAPFSQWNWSSPERIDYKINGGATLQFFPTAGSVSSVALFVSVVNATAVGLTAYACGDTVYIQAEDTTEGATLEILSSTTFTSLGLTPGVYLQEDNSFFLYSFSSLDTQASSFSSGMFEDSKETFEAQWSELAAEFVTPLSEDFVLAGGETLELTVDDVSLAAPPDFTVTFTLGTKSAQDIADEVNAVSSPTVVASALPSGQVKISCPGNYRKSLKVGGTSLSIFGLDSITPNPVVIDGTESYTTELTSSNPASFGAIPSAVDYEDFESLWPDNQDYMYMFTIRTLTYNQVADYQTYNATVNGNTVSYTAAVGDTPTIVASAISAKIDALADFTSTASVGEVTVVPNDERNRVEYSANEPLSSDVVVGTQESSAKISFAVFTGSKPEEDFEAQWLNNQTDIRLFTSSTVRINTVVPSSDYSVTINGETFTYSHGSGGPPGAFFDIAEGLKGLIDGFVTPRGGTVTAVNSTILPTPTFGEVTLTVTPTNQTLDVSVQGPVDDTTMSYLSGDTSGLLGRASFNGGAPADEENFDAPATPVQKLVEFNAASTGIWEIVILGQTFFVDNSGGALSVTNIRDSFVNQISIGSVEIDAFAFGVDTMGLRSTRSPPAQFEFSVKSPNPPIDFTLDDANIATAWAYDGTLTSPI